MTSYNRKYKIARDNSVMFRVFYIVPKDASIVPKKVDIVPQNGYNAVINRFGAVKEERK